VAFRFHLEKYIVRALGKEKDKKEELREALRRFDLPRAQQILKNAQENAPSKHKRKAVAECRRYIKNNWEGIEIYQKYPVELKGCSAEGHVSHILSARLSRRPGGWSKKGADQMARLRVIKGNGEEVKEKYLAQRTPLGKAAIKICPQVLRLQRKAKGELRERLDNIPALKGPVSSLTKALKALVFAL
jgi:hypothetical protein